MKAADLTVEQWWIVALVTPALFVAAVYFCVRNKRAALYSLIAPALGAISVIGHSRIRGHVETEALVIFSTCMLSLALLLVAMRPEVRKIAEKARLGEEYEIPKWKINLYAVLVLTFATVVVFLLL
ncbi:hypothetical protein OG292_23675 [Streptomyces sp. NBC_01511]|uniref:hypothetical protein n=1 Tax=unclassified Streptomyces TaxID=2593676 RepID=UPI00386AF5AC